MTNIHWKYRALKINKIEYSDSRYHYGKGTLQAKVNDGDKELHFLGGTNIPMRVKKKSYKKQLKTERYIKNRINRNSMMVTITESKGFCEREEEKFQALLSAKNR